MHRYKDVLVTDFDLVRMFNDDLWWISIFLDLFIAFIYESVVQILWKNII